MAVCIHSSLSFASIIGVYSTKLNYQKTHLLGDTPWSAFVNTGLEYDEFKAFDLRFNITTGLGFYWLKNETTTLVTRFGAGTAREFASPDESWVPEAMFGYEALHQLTPRQQIKGKLDYFPQWDRFSDFRLVSDVAWEILLDGTDNLSLKLSATNRHDSTPWWISLAQLLLRNNRKLSLGGYEHRPLGLYRL